MTQTKTEQHTPGPWKQDVRNVGGEDHEQTLVIDASGRGVATAVWRDEWPANAKLIAAAPMMLDALRTAAEALDNYSDVNDGDDGQPVANRAMSALQLVEAAIERAEGR